MSSVVDVGGLASPCVADYQKTIDKLADIKGCVARRFYPITNTELLDAQRSRYLELHLPLSFLGEYQIENPETGGLAISDLWTKYDGRHAPKIGTAILLSVLEHVDDPFEAAEDLRDAMADGGLAIVSVPFTFPYHAECGQDCWRFTPTGLRKLFEKCGRWNVLEADWRLDIPSEAGVIDLKTGRAQEIKSCYAVARAI